MLACLEMKREGRMIRKERSSVWLLTVLIVNMFWSPFVRSQEGKRNQGEKKDIDSQETALLFLSLTALEFKVHLLLSRNCQACCSTKYFTLMIFLILFLFFLKDVSTSIFFVFILMR